MSEDEIEEQTTNLCMEYILKNDLFNVLAIMAEKEKLIGVRILVIKFMTNLISKLKIPVLAHQSVFGSVQVNIKFKMICFARAYVLNTKV